MKLAQYALELGLRSVPLSDPAGPIEDCDKVNELTISQLHDYFTLSTWNKAERRKANAGR